MPNSSPVVRRRVRSSSPKGEPMVRQLSCSLTAFLGCVTIGAAQNPPAPPAPPPQAPAAAPQAPAAAPQASGAAGTWDASTMVGPKDSVVTTYVLTVAADGKSATIKLAGRDPIPTRIVVLAGDSIVTETGPYPSVLRPGQTVTLLRSVAHYKGNTMTGTFEAHYSNGDVLKGKTKATRAK